MGAPAIVMNDLINGICSKHLMPSGSGTQPAGPRAFTAKITEKTISSVLIGGRAAAVVGCSGTNDNPAHQGIVDGAFAS